MCTRAFLFFLTVSGFIYGQEKYYATYQTKSGIGIHLTDFDTSKVDDVRLTYKEYEFIDPFVFSEEWRGVSKTYFRFRENGKMGIMNTKGKEIITATYDSIVRCDRWGGEAMPLIPDFFVLTRDGRSWLKRSTNLKNVFPESYDSISYDDLYGDVRCFKNNRVKYFCNDGKQMFPEIEFESVTRIYSKSSYDEYKAPLQIIAKEPGRPMSVYSEEMLFRNKEDALIHNFVIESENYSSKLLILASKNGKIGLLDERGNIRIPFLYDSLIPIHPWYENHYSNRMITILDGKEGMCDFNHRPIYTAEYAKGSFFENECYYNGGLYIVSKGDPGMQGLLDINGKEIIPLAEQTIEEELIHNSSYDQDFFYVTRNGKMGVYDINGKEIIPLAEQTIEKLIHKSSYDHDFFYVTRNGKMGVYDDAGTEIIPCSYYRVNDENSVKYDAKSPKFITFGTYQEY